MAEKTIFISCMPFGYTEEDIQTLFQPFSEIKKISLYQDIENATFEAYAHVDVAVDDLENLLLKLDGKQIGSKYLRVNELFERKE